MEFFELRTVYDLAKRHNSKLTTPEFVEWAKNELAANQPDPKQRSVELSRFETEQEWMDNGRPYFNVWPDVVPLLTNVNVDVPASYLRLPFSAFVLRLPKTGNPLAVDEQHPVKAVLVWERLLEDHGRTVCLWVDIGEDAPNGIPMLQWASLNCSSDKTIESAFAGKPMPGLPGLIMSDELKHRLLRLAVSVCFLYTGTDRLIEPDILSKDLAAYLEAHRKGDDQKIREIRDRAVRRGKRGWNVGQHERLRPLASQSNGAEETGTRGPLTHQHQRRAHFRLLATGAVIFVRQVTVRPDLPPPEHAPGYGVQ